MDLVTGLCPMMFGVEYCITKECFNSLCQDNASFHPFDDVFFSAKLMSTSATVQACQKVQRRWTKWQFENGKKIYMYTYNHVWQGDSRIMKHMAIGNLHLTNLSIWGRAHSAWCIPTTSTRGSMYENWESVDKADYLHANMFGAAKPYFFEKHYMGVIFAVHRSILKTVDVVKVYQVF